MSKTSVALLAALFLAPLIVYLLWPTDESRIRRLFREGAKAVEQEKIDDVLSRVSFNYTDEHGLSYIVLKEMLGRVFQQMSGIKVEYEIKNITVKEASATADLDLRVIASHGQDTGYAVGDSAKPAHIKFYLEKERTKWLVSKTEGIPLDF